VLERIRRLMIESAENASKEVLGRIKEATTTTTVVAVATQKQHWRGNGARR
jgi:hypothetical protein